MTPAPAGVAGPMTAKRLAELPDDGWRYELIEGSCRPWRRRGASTAGWRSRSVGASEITSSGFRVRRHPGTVRAPDLAFIRVDRDSRLDEAGCSEIVPDLAVEVVSPSDRSSDVIKRALFWLEVGVRLVWVIDPEAQVVQTHRSEDVIGLLQGDDAMLSGEDVLPGFELRARRHLHLRAALPLGAPRDILRS